MNRRQFSLLLLLYGSSALAMAGRKPIAWAAPPDDVFTLGVASGSPSADGFVLWTRLLGKDLPAAPIDVAWSLMDPNDTSKVLLSGSTFALPELGYSVHVELNGLAADRWYMYRFRVGNVYSATGRTRTLPALNSAPPRLRLAYASCQCWDHGYYAAYRHMLLDRPDLVVFLGDYIYEGPPSKSPSAVRPHTLPAAKSLSDYRQRYALYKSDPALQAMHAACPWLVSWDDHEVENNYAGDLLMSVQGQGGERRKAAYQAYYEHMPMRTSTMINGLKALMSGGELRIYDSYDFGRLARIYMLDDRQYRSPPLCGDNPSSKLATICDPMPDPDQQRSFLGARQEGWLANKLADAAGSNVRWNIIAQQTRFTAANYSYGMWTKMNRDAWDGYPESRQRLIDALLMHKPNNPVILGGDIHKNWVANVHQNPYSVETPVIAAEYCGTSISSVSEANAQSDAKALSGNPHCRYINSQRRGYGLVEIESDQITVTLRGVDDARRPDSGVTALATFITRNGKPGVEQLT